ncbi:MAG: glucokinase [Symploca sp. SIO2E6]|nr:glucokinase [Symploca sp. SIO2E6]
MTLLLAGDIGGTKTILRLVKAEGDKPLQVLHEALYRSQDFPDLVPIVQQFLSAAQQKFDSTLFPEKACLGIAGPVINDTCVLTNLDWSLDARQLEQELGIAKVSLINDFAAICYTIQDLPAEDLLCLQEATPQSEAPIAIIGAGTGLGECFMVNHQGDYQIIATEGGHADFAPRTELEFQLRQYLLKLHNIQRVSVERVVSGQGIVSIYQFLRDQEFAPESPEIQQVIKTWEKETDSQEKTVDPAAAIANAALGKRDHLSEKTMQMFLEAYGVEAGNLALRLMPFGGLYIAGGIAAKILPLMQEGTFLRSFTQKGRITPLIKKVPIHIILNPQVGLIGAALHAARL